MHKEMRKMKLFSLILIIPCQFLLSSSWNSASAREYYFNPELLELKSPSVASTDLSVFEQRGKQAPGQYRIDLYLNGERIDTRDVRFIPLKDNNNEENLQPCLSVDEFVALGVNVTQPVLWEATSCVNLALTIKDASMLFRFDKQQLDISIPQAALKREARGYMPPEQWDHGIPAFILNYNFTGANSRVHSGSGGDQDSYYLNLRSGLNIGPWRLRNYSTWNRDSTGEAHWNSINNYLQRDIVPLKSQLVIGDSTSPGDIFDSVPFQGIQLASDDEMLPDSLKGFAPVVRGIAKTNAQVTIKQNGYIIYQSYVSPGAFEISDLFPTSGSGDLEVSVKETDGTEQIMLVPYAAVPILQREGRLKFSLTAGQYKTWHDNREKPWFAQGTGIYGLPWGITVYSGLQGGADYTAWSLGFGQNLGRIGAISADMTQSRANIHPHEDPEQGESWRVRYSKSFINSGTNFSLASYRYSTAGFYTLQDAFSSQTDSNDYQYLERKKARAELTLSQSLWDNFGSLNVSLMRENYWNSGNTTMSATLGYYNSWGRVNYGLNYTYSKYSSAEASQADHIVALNINLPLSDWLPGSYVSYGASRSRSGYTAQNITLSGSLLERNNLNYSLYQGYSSDGNNTSNLNLDYKGGRAEATLGYARETTQHRLNYGLQGGILLHENGLTLSQPLGETVVLVKAPGAKNTEIVNYIGVETDARGYAVVPYASAYRKTNIKLETASFADEVDMERNSLSSVPTRGAVSRVHFNVQIGKRALITLLQADSTPVPFGAIVTHNASQAKSSAIVADAGQVYLSGLRGNGTLQVVWGNNSAQQCKAEFSLPELDSSPGIQFVTTKCL